MFLSSVLVIFAAQVEPQISAAYAFKDLTVSGLLLAAVVYLYRELGRERKAREESATDTKAFVEKQTAIQSEVFDKVASALGSLEASQREQIEIHRTHIKAIVDAALPSLKR
jgi:hypothetical protein